MRLSWAAAGNKEQQWAKCWRQSLDSKNLSPTLATCLSWNADEPCRFSPPTKGLKGEHMEHVARIADKTCLLWQLQLHLAVCLSDGLR